jgi:hypothetical protein
MSLAALGAETVARIVKTIAMYDHFCQANDPHEEHERGSLRDEDVPSFAEDEIGGDDNYGRIVVTAYPALARIAQSKMVVKMESAKNPSGAERPSQRNCLSNNS